MNTEKGAPFPICGLVLVALLSGFPETRADTVGKPLLTLGYGSLQQLALAPDGKQFATAGEGLAGLLIWDVESGKVVRRFAQEWTSWYALAYSPDGRLVAAASPGGGAALLLN